MTDRFKPGDDPRDHEPGVPEPLIIPDDEAAEAATADLEERTAHLPDPSPEHAWWTWWSASGQEELTRLLREQWNPIGSEDVPSDEYASYALRLGDLLREGIPELEIADFLSDVRTGALGLEAERERDEAAAALVHAWYLQAHRAAE